MINGIGHPHKLGKQNMQQHGVINNPSKKTHPIKMIMISEMKTLMWEVNNHYPQINILLQILLYKVKLLISFKLILYPCRRKKYDMLQISLLTMTTSRLKHLRKQ